MMWPVSAQLTGTDPNMDNILKAKKSIFAFGSDAVMAAFMLQLLFTSHGHELKLILVSSVCSLKMSGVD